MNGSLRVQIFAALLLLALVSSLLTGAIVWAYVNNSRVEAERTSAAENLVTQRIAIDYIAAADSSAKSAAGLQGWVDSAAADLGDRVAVLDRDSKAKLADSDPTGGAIALADQDAVVNPPLDFIAMIGSDGNIRNDAFEACGGDCFEPVVGYRPPIVLAVWYQADDEGQRFDLLGAGLAGVAVALLSAGSAALVARRVARPINALSETAMRFGRGDLTQRFDSGAGREVRQLATSFNAMADDLERSEKARQNMVADLAHELRNPIGTILGNLEAVQDGVLPLDHDAVVRLHTEAGHLARLVEDMQQLASADIGSLTMQFESTDVDGLVRETVRLHEQSAHDKKILLSVNVDSPLRADVDATRLHQVLTNLINNAIRYTDPGGKVTVGAAAVDGRLVVNVRDTGIGLSEEEQELVFERFWQADESRSRSSGGSGIGLSISRELVKAHNGTLTVTSELHRGCEFVVSIPQRRELA